MPESGPRSGPSGRELCQRLARVHQRLVQDRGHQTPSLTHPRGRRTCHRPMGRLVQPPPTPRIRRRRPHPHRNRERLLRSNSNPSSKLTSQRTESPDMPGRFKEAVPLRMVRSLRVELNVRQGTVQRVASHTPLPLRPKVSCWTRWRQFFSASPASRIAWEGSMTGIPVGSTSVAAVLNPVNPAIATTSTPSASAADGQASP